MTPGDNTTLWLSDCDKPDNHHHHHQVQALTVVLSSTIVFIGLRDTFQFYLKKNLNIFSLTIKTMLSKRRSERLSQFMFVCVPGDHLVPGPLPASLHPPGKCSPRQLLQSRHLRPPVHRTVAGPPVRHQVLPRPHHGLLCSLSQPTHGVRQDP